MFVDEEAVTLRADEQCLQRHSGGTQSPRHGFGLLDWHSFVMPARNQKNGNLDLSSQGTDETDNRSDGLIPSLR